MRPDLFRTTSDSIATVANRIARVKKKNSKESYFITLLRIWSAGAQKLNHFDGEYRHLWNRLNGIPMTWA